MLTSFSTVCARSSCCGFFFFFFNDTATTEIYTLSLHDALPISVPARCGKTGWRGGWRRWGRNRDRKSTRLNSSHLVISYAVFCLTKKTNTHADRQLFLHARGAGASHHTLRGR